MTYKFYQYNTYLIVFFLLILMGLMAIFSIQEDTFTFDETAHVVAGYSYLTQKDMRLNPEHPPLIKDLAAIPLLFLNLNFPKEHPAWLQEDAPYWWHQFDLGSQFLYREGNNPDQILWWSRLPMILLTLLLGLLLFFWTKKVFGKETALLATALFAFSPTFLAHGRLVTTDVGAAFGVVLATAFFLNFIKNPSWKNTLFAGAAFGIAQLIKFNLILLYPFFGILFLVWIFISVKKQGAAKEENQKYSNILQNVGIFFSKFVVVMTVTWILIWLVYAFHIQNLPKEIQLRNVEFLTKTHPFAKFVTPAVTSVSRYDISRPWGYYLLGVAMATERASGGNTTYFMGEVSAAGWTRYFSIVYALKEPFAFHILTIIALLFAALAVQKPLWQKPWQRLNAWTSQHFTKFAMLLWLAIYWGSSVSGNLNIGMRHLAPLLPFTYILVSWTAIEGFKKYSNILQNVRISNIKIRNLGYLVIAVLLVWQALSVIKVYPHFISYFNELAGGPSGGSRYVVDSNLDWGQDLKRFARWFEENCNKPAPFLRSSVSSGETPKAAQERCKVKIAYFGGGDIKYYLGDKATPFSRDDWEVPQKGWLAISATELRGGQATPAHDFNQPTDYFYWLLPYEPVKVIGHSIFVYYIP